MISIQIHILPVSTLAILTVVSFKRLDLQPFGYLHLALMATLYGRTERRDSRFGNINWQLK